MVEYYQDEKATRESFTDGYFKTGDIGHIDDDGFLFITDRKKDLIKTAGGKYVAPQKLEGLLKINPYVSNVLIHGDLKKYIVALITLNHAVVLNYAKLKGLPELSFQDLVKTPEIYALVRDIVADANSHLASFESIKKFAILPNDFTIETGELTPSLKVKRRFCDTKFKQDIDELYT
jgi:long-chain acyl-CoA synthetase